MCMYYLEFLVPVLIISYYLLLIMRTLPFRRSEILFSLIIEENFKKNPK